MNAKLKQDVSTYSTLIDFINVFFGKFIEYRNHEFQSRKIQEKLRKSVKQYPENSEEAKFQRSMTTFAFKFIVKEIENSKTITFLSKDDEKMECTVAFNRIIFNVTTNKCTCFTITSLLLPTCRHILALRRMYGLQLFDESYKANRWMERRAGSDTVLSQSPIPFKKSGECIDAPCLTLIGKRDTSKQETRMAQSSVVQDILKIGTNINSPECYSKFISDLKQVVNRHRDGTEEN